MQTDPSSIQKIRPPQLISSLTGGFNAVANHIYLILLPIALDLFLWLGPHLRLKSLLEPFLTDVIALLRESGSMEMIPMLDNIENLWTVLLDHYNLLINLSTFPLGVPSLMAGQLPLETPLGQPEIIEISALWQLVLGWLGISLLGLFLGSAFYAWVANCTGRQIAQEDCAGIPAGIPAGPLAQESAAFAQQMPAEEQNSPDIRPVPPLTPKVLLWQTLQLVLLVLIVLIVALMLLGPGLLISSFLALISPALAQLALLVISFGVIWMMVPLVFSPHGIYLCGLNAFSAIFNSTRVVRFSLPSTGLFLLSLVVLYQGMGLLWRTPPDNSWMLLVGVFGHAFITTGLLAASFVYYRSGLQYIQALRKIGLRSL
ncbi:MAG: hypothetical protein GX491_17945 [Chloroflexi bacterium]|nr:hypothetical protein [Chloroflexota bacterium]